MLRLTKLFSIKDVLQRLPKEQLLEPPSGDGSPSHTNDVAYATHLNLRIVGQEPDGMLILAREGYDPKDGRKRKTFVDLYDIKQRTLTTVYAHQEGVVRIVGATINEERTLLALTTVTRQKFHATAGAHARDFQEVFETTLVEVRNNLDGAIYSIEVVSTNVQHVQFIYNKKGTLLLFIVDREFVHLYQIPTKKTQGGVNIDNPPSLLYEIERKPYLWHEWDARRQYLYIIAPNHKSSSASSSPSHSHLPHAFHIHHHPHHHHDSHYLRCWSFSESKKPELLFELPFALRGNPRAVFSSPPPPHFSFYDLREFGFDGRVRSPNAHMLHIVRMRSNHAIIVCQQHPVFSAHHHPHMLAGPAGGSAAAAAAAPVAGALAGLVGGAAAPAAPGGPNRVASPLRGSTGGAAATAGTGVATPSGTAALQVSLYVIHHRLYIELNIPLSAAEVAALTCEGTNAATGDAVATSGGTTPAVPREPKVLFDAIGDMLVVYIPGVHFQLVDLGDEHEPCFSLRLSGPQYANELPPPLAGARSAVSGATPPSQPSYAPPAVPPIVIPFEWRLGAAAATAGQSQGARGTLFDAAGGVGYEYSLSREAILNIFSHSSTPELLLQAAHLAIVHMHDAELIDRILSWLAAGGGSAGGHGNHPRMPAIYTALLKEFMVALPYMAIRDMLNNGIGPLSTGTSTSTSSTQADRAVLTRLPITTAPPIGKDALDVRKRHASFCPLVVSVNKDPKKLFAALPPVADYAPANGSGAAEDDRGSVGHGDTGAADADHARDAAIGRQRFAPDRLVVNPTYAAAWQRERERQREKEALIDYMRELQFMAAEAAAAAANAESTPADGGAGAAPQPAATATAATQSGTANSKEAAKDSGHAIKRILMKVFLREDDTPPGSPGGDTRLTHSGSVSASGGAASPMAPAAAAAALLMPPGSPTAANAASAEDDQEDEDEDDVFPHVFIQALADALVGVLTGKDAKQRALAWAKQYRIVQIRQSNRLFKRLAGRASPAGLSGGSGHYGLQESVQFALLQHFYGAIEELRYPFPKEFHRKFAMLGWTCLPRHVFVQYVERRIFKVTPELFKHISGTLTDSLEDMNFKYFLASKLPSSQLALHVLQNDSAMHSVVVDQYLSMLQMLLASVEPGEEDMQLAAASGLGVARANPSNPTPATGGPSPSTLVDMEATDRSFFIPLTVFLTHLTAKYHAYVRHIAAAAAESKKRRGGATPPRTSLQRSNSLSVGAGSPEVALGEAGVAAVLQPKLQFVNSFTQQQLEQIFLGTSSAEQLSFDSSTPPTDPSA